MVQNAMDNAVYTFRLDDQLFILLTNVDDYLIFASRNSIYEKVKKKLSIILDMVKPYFPRLQHFSKTNTPMRTDKKFEIECTNSLPTTKEDLKQLEVEFGSLYLTLYGQLVSCCNNLQTPNCKCVV